MIKKFLAIFTFSAMSLYANSAIANFDHSGVQKGSELDYFSRGEFITVRVMSFQQVSKSKTHSTVKLRLRFVEIASTQIYQVQCSIGKKPRTVTNFTHGQTYRISDSTSAPEVYRFYEELYFRACHNSDVP